jgi:A/G-specific adenine glycosylase
MVSGFTGKEIAAKRPKRHKKFFRRCPLRPVAETDRATGSTLQQFFAVFVPFCGNNPGVAGRNRQSAIRDRQLSRLVPLLLDWFATNARDLPWRRTRDPYAIWVSEIMLQQTQVKTVIPYWNRWMRELPTIEAVAKASPARIHKLWEGLGYYTRARNLQNTARQILADCRRRGNESQTEGKSKTPHVVSCKFPGNYDEVLALPGIGRYTAGAICSIAFNQPMPILDGNVIRVLTRIFGIAENPKEKETNARLWKLAETLVTHAKDATGAKVKTTLRSSRPLREETSCSHLNQSLMELGALVCTPRNPQCEICPVRKLCVAFQENRVEELPNLGKRQAATARRFVAFIIESGGQFLVRQRPAGVVNAHLWEFPNTEVNGASQSAKQLFKSSFGFVPPELSPLCTVKHSITRYRITLEAFHVHAGGTSYTSPFFKTAKLGTRVTRPSETIGVWKTPAQMRRIAFASAHKKILGVLEKRC